MRDDGEGYEKVNSHDRGSCVIGRVIILFYILYTRTFFSRAPLRLDKRWKLNINFSTGHCFFWERDLKSLFNGSIHRGE